MQMYTLCALTYLFGLESPTGKKIFRLPWNRCLQAGVALLVPPFAHVQSDFLSALWPPRGPRQGQGLNDFPLVEACLCQFAH